MQKPQIYLASQSPQRRLLIEQLGLRYQSLQVHVDETPLSQEQPAAFVARLALEKARAGWQQVAGELIPVVGADTCIVLNRRIIGKPRNKSEGIELLRQYSGATHQVYTGVAVVGPQAQTADSAVVEQVRVNQSSVTFRVLSDEDGEKYWLSGEPLDKAGGYAIQGKAAAFIQQLQGSYSGVMGLPLCELAELLRLFGIQIFDK